VTTTSRRSLAARVRSAAIALAALTAPIALAACGGGGDAGTPVTPEAEGGQPAAATVAELGGASRRFVTVATAREGLAVPRDLDFHPARRHELWVVNRGFEGTVTLSDAGLATQRATAYADAALGIGMAPGGAVVKMDSHRSHFMQQVIAVAMGAEGTFATCHEGTQQFMGPTLWDGDTAVYAKRDLPGWGQLGSHVDMLHQTPQCLGIAHDRDNVFWVSDGTAGNIVRYDFRRDHGPGHDDHSDGVVRRYPEATVRRVPDVPGHLALDRESGWLYYADPGNARVVRLQTRGGAVGRALAPFAERLAEYSEVRGATVEVVVARGLTRPAGLALANGRLFVSDHATNEIVAFDVQGRELQRVKTPASGIMGIALGPDGKLWYVDGAANAVVRVDP
jgi:hypothetical protein